MNRFLSHSLTVVLLVSIAACASGRDAASLTPSASRDVRAAGGAYATVYSFGTNGGAYDAQGQRAELLAWNGLLYGVSSAGGTHNLGTAYTIQPNGTESVLHSFGSTGDGIAPLSNATLVAVGKKLYGTTYGGGKDGHGTVYALSASGREQILYSFPAAKSGTAYPNGSLGYLGGALYGTLYGSYYNKQSIFRVSTKGGGRMAYEFANQFGPSGSRSGLVAIGKTLYGTSESGGAHHSGTIFAYAPPGSGSVVFNFIPQINGQNPESNLIAVDGVLYGTARGGDGVAYGVTPAGNRVMLHQFTGGDGISPTELTYAKGTLYGTASGGGKYGYGTLFSISMKGRVQVLHDFQGGTDGANPQSGVTYLDGKLYGTTATGGTNNLGVVYAYTP